MSKDFESLKEVTILSGSGINSLLAKYGIAFMGQTYQGGNFIVKDREFLDITTDKLFFLIMSRILTDKNKKQQFIDAVIKGDELKNWKDPVRLSNKFENIVNELDRIYSKELRLEEKIFKDLRKDKNFKDLVDGLDKMYQPGKVRKFNYVTVASPTAEEVNKILSLYDTQQSNNRETYEDKKTFN